MLVVDIIVILGAAFLLIGPAIRGEQLSRGGMIFLFLMGLTAGLTLIGTGAHWGVAYLILIWPYLSLRSECSLHHRSGCGW